MLQKDRLENHLKQNISYSVNWLSPLHILREVTIAKGGNVIIPHLQIRIYLCPLHIVVKGAYLVMFAIITHQSILG